jgi:predicted metal-binding membrane protein
MGLLVVTAWLALWIWSESPYARYLDHGDWTRMGFAASICAALPAGETVFPIVFYTCGWLLMLVAMMLPTTLPLLDIYRRLTRPRKDHRLLLALVIAGYLAAWAMFGFTAHGVDWLLHWLVDHNPWLVFNGWVFQVAVLLVAGSFQFSSLKYRCLDKCRMPLGFVLEHWRGNSECRQAFRLGVIHGLFCVGCCWALMLLMFVVGTGNIGWMMLLGAIMAAEKNLPWGRHLGPLFGTAFLALAAVTLIQGIGII